MAGGMAPLQPEPTGTTRRKSLMPGSGLFRRASKANEGGGPASPGVVAAGGAQDGQAASFGEGAFTAEPEQQQHEAARVDEEGYSLPPQGYDRGIQETARAAPNGSTSLLDDDDEDEQLNQRCARPTPLFRSVSID